MKDRLLFFQIHEAEALGQISREAKGACETVRSLRFDLGAAAPEPKEESGATEEKER